ncbi:hypothetical protein [Psychrobacter pocilloporae]|uniref:Uncharacterized protein n=1 Tax=Psychrobacter pocilloporae TaxID=1775882 RepID=A0ABT6ITC3_9GAMM|nr:hypothetical protein [Psychrobacter pocilloporae]MDH4905090.1 hypothetical protein [Psychrobacter pocilloporae]
MKKNHREVTMILGLCAVFGASSATAGLQAFELENTEQPQCGYKDDSITRYTLDRQGKVLSKKTYTDWNEIDQERYP